MALITCIAYDTERNLGSAYNRTMTNLGESDWCCFLDHDAMFTTQLWRAQLKTAIHENPQVGLITVMTNRIGRKSQISPGCPNDHRLGGHFAFGRKLERQHGAAVRDITVGSPLSGVVMCLSRSTWERMGRFKDGFFGVENCAHRDVRKIGLRVGMMPGLYVYHWYLGDGRGQAKGSPRARCTSALCSMGSGEH